MTLRWTLPMIAPTVAISLLLLAVGVVTAWYVHRMQRRISNVLQTNVSSMRAAEELEIIVRELRTQVHHYLLSNNTHYLDRMQLLRPEVNRWLGEAGRWATTSHEQLLMREVRQGLTEFYAELDRPAPEVVEVRTLQLKRLADEVLTRQVLEPTHEYLDYNEKQVEKTSQENRIQAGRLIFGLLSLGICGCAAGMIAGMGLARALQQSLVQLHVPLRAAAGQLDEVVGPITFTAPFDLHQLQGAVTQIAEHISTIIERLRDSQREVLRAEQLAAVGQMAAGMAHELRNPLTAIKILVQAALSREDGEGAVSGRDLVVLEEEITRLERVMQTFLHFARPPRPEKRIVEARELIESSVALVQARADLCQVTLEVEAPPKPIPLEVDPGQFRQVLLNLLLNALDAVGSGGRIVVQLCEPRAGWVQLRVRDNGCGLPVDLEADIFTPFVSTKETGLGLGLSISRRIVEEHGGMLEANDLPERGAEFIVHFPAIEDSGTGRREDAQLVDRR